MTLNSTERLERFVARTSERIEAAELAGAGLESLPDSRLGVILSSCGWQRRSKANVRAIKEALMAYGISTIPDLQAGHLRADDRVYFIRGDTSVLRSSQWGFSSEEALEDFMFANWADLPLPLKGIELIGTQVQISGSKLDAVGYIKRNNEVVVVEFKNDGADDRTVGQIDRYLRKVSELSESTEGFSPEPTRRVGTKLPQFPLRGYSTRALLISRRGNTDVRDSLAARSTPEMPIDWWTFDASISFNKLLSS